MVIVPLWIGLNDPRTIYSSHCGYQDQGIGIKRILTFLAQDSRNPLPYLPAEININIPLITLNEIIKHVQSVLLLLG